MDRVSIANTALLAIGNKRIGALDEGTTEADLVSQEIDNAIRSCLEAHSWNFASRWEELALNATAPMAEYTSSFALPSDFVRIHSTYPDLGRYYRIMERNLHCNATNLLLRYVFWTAETSTGSFKQYFGDAVAYNLANRISYAFTLSADQKKSLLQESELYLSRAKTLDSQEEGMDDVEENIFAYARCHDGIVP